MNDRSVFHNVLANQNAETPPFVPFVLSLAARTANISVEEMVQDPTYYTSALEGFYGLLNAGTTVVNYDDTLESTALGVRYEWKEPYGPSFPRDDNDYSENAPDDFVKRGRIPVVLETIKRLKQTSAETSAVTCAILGPCSFSYKMKSIFKLGTSHVDDLQNRYCTVLPKLVRALCEQKIDVVFFREDLLQKDFLAERSKNSEIMVALYKTVFKIVRAFNASPVIVTDRLPLENIETLAETLDPSGIVLLGELFREEELLYLKDIAEKLKIALGLPLPIRINDQESLDSYYRFLNAFVSTHKMQNVFYTSDGEIQHDVDLEILFCLSENEYE